MILLHTSSMEHELHMFQMYDVQVTHGLMVMLSCLPDTNNQDTVIFSKTICSLLTVLADGFGKHFAGMENNLKADKNLDERMHPV